MNPLQQSAEFLIVTLFDLYLMVLLLRFILQYLKADYYNPFTQFVLKCTQPVVKPLRRFIPGWRGIDFATLSALYGFALIKLFLIALIHYKTAPFVPGLLIWGIADLLKLVINLYFWGIILQVILSWVSPMSHTPFTEILYRLTWPVLKPFKRFIPPLGGIDITPLFAILALQLINILIVNTLVGVGVIISITG